VPVNPLTGETVTVDVPLAPATVVMLVGPAVMVKSGGLIVIVICFEPEKLVPMTVPTIV
jgi:hypothetical protein